MAGRTVEVARAVVAIEAETKGIEQQLTQVEKSLGRTAKFVQDHPIAAFTALGSAIVGLGVKAAFMADEVNRGIGALSARVGDVEKNFTAVQQAVKKASVESGLAQSEILEQMKLVAEGGQTSTDVLLKVHGAVLKVSEALGGGPETFTAVFSVADSLMDQFGITADEIGGVLARLFVTLQGKTNFTDLAAVLEKTGKAAKESGIDYGTLADAAVDLLSKGLNTKQVVGELTRELNEDRGELLQHAAAAHVASDGQKALQARIDEVNKSAGKQSDIIRQQLSANMTDFGQKVLPLVSKALQGVNFLLSGVDFSVTGLWRKKTDELATSTKNLGGALDDATGLTLAFLQSQTSGAKAAETLTKAQKNAVIASKELTDGQKNAILTAKTLSEVQRKEVTAALKEAGEAAKQAARDQVQADEDAARSRRALLQLEKEYTNTGVDLATFLATKREDLEVHLHETLKDLKGKDIAEGERIATIARANFEQYAKAITDTLAQFEADSLKPTLITTAKLTEQTDLQVTNQKSLNDAVVKGTAAYHGLKEGEDAAAETTRKHRLEVAGIARDFGDATDGLRSMAEALGDAGADLQDFLGGLTGVADGISGIFAGLAKGSAGDVLGGIGAGLSGLIAIGKQFFGESESARRVRLAVEANTAKLEEHRRVLGDLIQVETPGGKLAGAQTALSEVLGRRSIGFAFQPTELLPALLKQGLGIADLESIAKDLGIDIHGGGPNFLVSGIRKLLESLQAVEPTQFRNDLQGQLDFVRKRAQLLGLGAGSQLTDLLGILGGPQGAPSLFGSLSGLDLTTAEGRSALQAAIARLIEQTRPGTTNPIPTAAFGGLSGPQFLDLLQSLADLVRQVAQDAGAPVTADLPPSSTGQPALPVEPIIDPAFPPSVESDNWTQALTFEGRTADATEAIQAILETLSTPLVQAPALPAGASLAAQGSALGGTTINVAGPLIGTLVLSPLAGFTPAEQADEVIRQLDLKLGGAFFQQQQNIGSTVIQ